MTKKKATRKKSRKGVGGRPSKYKPEYCEAVIKWFDKPTTIEVVVEKPMKDGVVSYVEIQGCEFPTMYGFAAHLKVNVDTIYQWAKVHPEFSDAIKIAQAFQGNILIQNAIKGRYSAMFSALFAKNNMGWVDRTETKVEDTTKDKRLIIDLKSEKSDE